MTEGCRLMSALERECSALILATMGERLGQRGAAGRADVSVRRFRA